jgi:hypothetical protein
MNPAHKPDLEIVLNIFTNLRARAADQNHQQICQLSSDIYLRLFYMKHLSFEFSDFIECENIGVAPTTLDNPAHIGGASNTASDREGLLGSSFSPEIDCLCDSPIHFVFQPALEIHRRGAELFFRYET